MVSQCPEPLKSQVLRSRATGGEKSGNNGSAVERHDGLGRSRIDRQFLRSGAKKGVKQMPPHG